MDNLIIERKNFLKSQKDVKNLLKKIDEKTVIDKVETEGGLFGWGNHKVTGEELNERIVVISQEFINLKTNHNKLLKIFRNLNKSVNFLYNDCIDQICKVVSHTNEQQKILDKHQQELNVSREKMEKTVDSLVEAIKELSKKANDNSHEIKEIYTDYGNTQNYIEVISESVTKLSKKIDKELELKKDSINDGQYDSMGNILLKKLKWAYILGGSALALSIVELVIVLFRGI